MTRSTSDTVQLLRRILLGLIALGIVGTVIELLLIGHYKELTQWPPLVLLGLSAVAVVIVTRKPTPRSLQWFRILMVVVALTSLLGVFFHLKGNIEFRLETNPELSGAALLWRAMQGGVPLLAPGVMAQVGLLGLAFTFRHPALKKQLETSRIAEVTTI
jgi:predicted membrane channel-forming protein YqfA (hemolysin III family)